MIRDVDCDRVSKRYRVPSKLTASSGVRRALRRGASALWAPREEFWALRDVSFSVARGEAVGLIGRNGAGKSTILKLLTGITAPTRGQITIRGRLAALIELGSGFHPELTGRENAYLSGSMLGLRRHELTAKLPGIIDFAGIGDFLDVPVKFYSSGMYVRLGFAIAALLEPDVLLVDEVLAVGDVEFQARCLRRIADLKRRGVTMIIVSHDLGAIEQLCDRVLLLDHGTIAVSGSGHEVITAYQQLAAGGSAATPAVAIDSSGSLPLEIVGLTVSGADGLSTLTVTAGEASTAAITVRAGRAFADVDARLSIYDFEHGTHLVECSSAAIGQRCPVPPGESRIEFLIPHLLLRPGVYTLGATVRPTSETRPVAWRFGRTTLYVEGSVSSAGALLLPFQCRVAAAPATNPAVLTS